MSETNDQAKLSSTEHAAIEHWSSFGRPGEPQRSRAVPTDGWAKSFSKPKTAQWHISLSKDDFRRLFQGFQPAQMEDKWLVYSTDPDAKGDVYIHMHRSWTGNRIVVLKVESPTEVNSNKARITGIKWETDKKIYNGDGEEGAKSTAREICRWVMGVELGSEQ